MKLRKVEIKKNKKNDITKSGYYNVFGDKEIAGLCRKIQSTTIRNGNELQDIILGEVSVQKLDKKIDLDSLIELVESGATFYIANYKISKKQLEKKGIKLKGKENIDIDAIFCKDKVLYIIEYKQGDNLDTKKSQGEVESLSKISEFFQHYNIETCPKLVMWICDDVKNSSIKTTENKEFLTTGKEACDILGISFENVENIRKSDQEDNIDFLFEEFEKIKKSLKK